jgi:hypothetical protein
MSASVEIAQIMPRQRDSAAGGYGPGMTSPGLSESNLTRS